MDKKQKIKRTIGYPILILCIFLGWTLTKDIALIVRLG
ncbi:unnamed protein product, partial [marine sediment metagenome]